MYVESIFGQYGYRSPGINATVSAKSPLYESARRETLSELEKKVYDIMKEAVIDIAYGKRSDTTIIIPVETILDKLEYTAEDLELDVLDNNTDISVQVYSKLGFDSSAPYYALQKDLTFEWYWHSGGASFPSPSYLVSYNEEQGENVLTFYGDISIYLSIDDHYSITDQNGNEYVDISKTAAPVIAEQRAQQIVKEASALPDYEKLVYYRNKICDLVNYNYDTSWNDDIITSRSIVYVFDEDPETNVVCEGYAKAFKYLCDQTMFDSSEIECHLVAGEMIVDGDSYRHMWNLVRMDDGCNYIVDITNDDDGMFAHGQLFLEGASNDSYTECTLNLEFYTVTYKYDSYALDYYSPEELRVAQKPYKTAEDYKVSIGEDQQEPIKHDQNSDINKEGNQSENDSVTDQFADVKETAYYADAVSWAVSKGITTGTSATTFSPDEECSRGQIVTFLWRAAGSPEVETTNTFTDVLAGKYYEKPVAWAVANKITTGTSLTTFSPNASCTRAQAVTFLYRTAGEPDVELTTTFTDVPANAYYAKAVAWAVQNGITKGTSATTFSPDEVCKRSQIVTFLYRSEH